MSSNWRIYIDNQPWSGTRRLFMVVGGPGGRRSYVQMPKLVTPEPGLFYDTPTLSETAEDQKDNLGDVTGFLQAALDAAWEIGMRPTAYADHTNELKAVRYHLEDMRALAMPKST